MRILTIKTIYLITIIAILINSNLFGKWLSDEEIKNVTRKISIMDIEGIYYFLAGLFLFFVIIFSAIYNSLKSYINREQYVSNYERLTDKVRIMEDKINRMYFSQPASPRTNLKENNYDQREYNVRGSEPQISDRIQVVNQNSPLIEQENVNYHEKSKGDSSLFYYADLPEPGSYFLESKLTNEKTPFSIYRFEFNNVQPNIMQFEFINRIDLYPKLYRIRNQVLKPACDYNDPVSEIRNIEVIQPGIVSKEGDRWKITSKIQLEIN